MESLQSRAVSAPYDTLAVFDFDRRDLGFSDDARNLSSISQAAVTFYKNNAPIFRKMPANEQQNHSAKMLNGHIERFQKDIIELKKLYKKQVQRGLQEYRQLVYGHSSDQSESCSFFDDCVKVIQGLIGQVTATSQNEPSRIELITYKALVVLARMYYFACEAKIVQFGPSLEILNEDQSSASVFGFTYYQTFQQQIKRLNQLEKQLFQKDSQSEFLPPQSELVFMCLRLSHKLDVQTPHISLQVLNGGQGLYPTVNLTKVTDKWLVFTELPIVLLETQKVRIEAAVYDFLPTDQQEKDFCIENAKPENVYYHRYQSSLNLSDLFRQKPFLEGQMMSLDAQLYTNVEDQCIDWLMVTQKEKDKLATNTSLQYQVAFVTNIRQNRIKLGLHDLKYVRPKNTDMTKVNSHDGKVQSIQAKELSELNKDAYDANSSNFIVKFNCLSIKEKLQAVRLQVYLYNDKRGLIKESNFVNGRIGKYRSHFYSHIKTVKSFYWGGRDIFFNSEFKIKLPCSASFFQGTSLVFLLCTPQEQTIDLSVKQKLNAINFKPFAFAVQPLVTEGKFWKIKQGQSQLLLFHQYFPKQQLNFGKPVSKRDDKIQLEITDVELVALKDKKLFPMTMGLSTKNHLRQLGYPEQQENTIKWLARMNEFFTLNYNRQQTLKLVSDSAKDLKLQNPKVVLAFLANKLQEVINLTKNLTRIELDQQDISRSEDACKAVWILEVMPEIFKIFVQSLKSVDDDQIMYKAQFQDLLLSLLQAMNLKSKISSSDDSFKQMFLTLSDESNAHQDLDASFLDTYLNQKVSKAIDLFKDKITTQVSLLQNLQKVFWEQFAMTLIVVQSEMDKQDFNKQADYFTAMQNPLIDMANEFIPNFQENTDIWGEFVQSNVVGLTQADSEERIQIESILVKNQVEFLTLLDEINGVLNQQIYCRVQAFTELVQKGYFETRIELSQVLDYVLMLVSQLAPTQDKMKQSTLFCFLRSFHGYCRNARSDQHIQFREFVPNILESLDLVLNPDFSSSSYTLEDLEICDELLQLIISNFDSYFEDDLTRLDVILRFTIDSLVSMNEIQFQPLYQYNFSRTQLFIRTYKIAIDKICSSDSEVYIDEGLISTLLQLRVRLTTQLALFASYNSILNVDASMLEELDLSFQKITQIREKIEKPEFSDYLSEEKIKQLVEPAIQRIADHNNDQNLVRLQFVLSAICRILCMFQYYHQMEYDGGKKLKVLELLFYLIYTLIYQNQRLDVNQKNKVGHIVCNQYDQAAQTLPEGYSKSKQLHEVNGILFRMLKTNPIRLSHQEFEKNKRHYMYWVLSYTCLMSWLQRNCLAIQLNRNLNNDYAQVLATQRKSYKELMVGKEKEADLRYNILQTFLHVQNMKSLLKEDPQGKASVEMTNAIELAEEIECFDQIAYLRQLKVSTQKAKFRELVPQIANLERYKNDYMKNRMQFEQSFFIIDDREFNPDQETDSGEPKMWVFCAPTNRSNFYKELANLFAVEVSKITIDKLEPLDYAVCEQLQIDFNLGPKKFPWSSSGFYDKYFELNYKKYFYRKKGQQQQAQEYLIYEVQNPFPTFNFFQEGKLIFRKSLSNIELMHLEIRQKVKKAQLFNVATQERSFTSLDRPKREKLLNETILQTFLATEGPNGAILGILIRDFSYEKSQGFQDLPAATKMNYLEFFEFVEQCIEWLGQIITVHKSLIRNDILSLSKKRFREITHLVSQKYALFRFKELKQLK